MKDKEEGCSLKSHWESYRPEIDGALEKIDEVHVNMAQLLEHAKHLPVLDSILVSVDDLKGKAMSAAIGTDRIPLSVVNDILTQLAKSNATLYKIFGAIVLGLLAVITYLLIGEHFDLIRHLN